MTGIIMYITNTLSCKFSYSIVCRILVFGVGEGSAAERGTNNNITEKG